MAVRAKFKVWNADQSKDGQSERVMMMPVTDDSPENKAWSQATPAGQLNMTITNPECFGKFVPGAEYYLDFSPAG